MADISALKPSLVEWKPPTRGAGTAPVRSLETFLSGMETNLSRQTKAGRIPSLKPSLVEWKLHCRGDQYVWRHPLKPSLVEWKPRPMH